MKDPVRADMEALMNLIVRLPAVNKAAKRKGPRVKRSKALRRAYQYIRDLQNEKAVHVNLKQGPHN